jgi:hypothetical protein
LWYLSAPCRLAGTDREFHLLDVEVHVCPAQGMLTRCRVGRSQRIAATKERIKHKEGSCPKEAVFVHLKIQQVQYAL